MPLLWMSGSPSKNLSYSKGQVHHWCIHVLSKICFGKSGSAGLSALQPVESTWAPHQSAPSSPGTALVLSLDKMCEPLGSVPILVSCSNPFIAPHPIIPVFLKFPNQDSVH